MSAVPTPNNVAVSATAVAPVIKGPIIKKKTTHCPVGNAGKSAFPTGFHNTGREIGARYTKWCNLPSPPLRGTSPKGRGKGSVQISNSSTNRNLATTTVSCQHLNTEGGCVLNTIF